MKFPWARSSHVVFDFPIILFLFSCYGQLSVVRNWVGSTDRSLLSGVGEHAFLTQPKIFI